ncbi:hypothetical protein KPH14_012986, partial [Odynerus spinipes]
GTINAKIEYSKYEDCNLVGYSDADWANETESRNSMTGYIFTKQGGPISWISKKQRTVALSSTEAEYIAMATACQEALWLNQLSKEIYRDDYAIEPIQLYCDNRGAIALAKNAITSQRNEMLADILTKALPKGKHTYLNVKLGIKHIVK